MISNGTFKFFDKFLGLMSLLIILFIVAVGRISSTFLGIYLLIINIYMCYKCKNKKNIFMLFIVLLYFNFSVVISKYIGEPSQMLSDLYCQILFDDTVTLGLLSQIVFFTIVNFILSVDYVSNINTDEDKKNSLIISFRYKKLLTFLFQIILVAILLYHILAHITVSTTLLEYSIFIFIFALFFSKNDKKNKIITEIILILFCFYSIKNGDRIAILQLLMADFLINYIDKFKIKQILLTLLLGIFSFTLFGLYGDFLDEGWDMSEITIKYTYNKISERRFALDTSVSAYFTGLAMIDSKDYYTSSYRINDGFEYLVKRSIFGSSSDYVPLNQQILTYRHNVGGGFLTCYFYFWFGWLGVIFIGIFMGIMLRKISKNDCFNAYGYLLSVFVVSTVPRWYLYEPNMLFRGVLLFSLLYFFIKVIFIGNEGAVKIINKV